jgi:hypothetical protein
LHFRISNLYFGDPPLAINIVASYTLRDLASKRPHFWA